MKVKEFSLGDAQAAVQRAVEDLATGLDPVVSEEQAAELAGKVAAFVDAFELDEWVFAHPQLKKRFCRYPLCFDPPRPPQQSGDGTRRGGNQPAYCADGMDGDGKPHTAKYAERRRKALRRERDARLGAATEGDQPSEAADRPVTQARNTFTTQAAELGNKFAELSGHVQNLLQIAERVGDETLRFGEIEAIKLKAEEDVARQARLVLDAQNSQRQAEEEVNRLTSELEEAADVNAQLTGELETEQGARASAEQAAETARHDAEHEIAEAKNKFLREEQEREAKRAELVSAANSERDAVKAAAEEAIRLAAAETATAKQAAKDATTQAERAEAELTSLRAENTGLRDKAIDREREFETAFGEQRQEHQHEASALRAKVEELHTTIEGLHNQAEQARTAHDSAIADLRDKHEQELQTRLAEAATNAERLRTTEVALLKARIAQLEAPAANLGDER